MFGKIKLHIVLTIGAILALAVLAACGGSATEPPAGDGHCRAAGRRTHRGAVANGRARRHLRVADVRLAHVGGFEQRAYCHALRLCGTVATAH